MDFLLTHIEDPKEMWFGYARVNSEHHLESNSPAFCVLNPQWSYGRLISRLIECHPATQGIFIESVLPHGFIACLLQFANDTKNDMSMVMQRHSSCSTNHKF